MDPGWRRGTLLAIFIYDFGCFSYFIHAMLLGLYRYFYMFVRHYDEPDLLCETLMLALSLGAMLDCSMLEAVATKAER
jgi:hypothetical protein